MKIAFALALAAAVGTTPAHAQALAPGTWTGKMFPPGGEVLDVTYDVTVNGDSIGITLNAGPVGAIPFRDVKLAGATLTFVFTPGIDVRCTLERRDDGSYQGDCTDDNGETGQLLMVPPEEGR